MEHAVQVAITSDFEVDPIVVNGMICIKVVKGSNGGVLAGTQE